MFCRAAWTTSSQHVIVILMSNVTVSSPSPRCFGILSGCCNRIYFTAHGRWRLPPACKCGSNPHWPLSLFFFLFFFLKPGRVEPLSCVYCDPFVSCKVNVCSDVTHSLALSRPQRDDFAHFGWWAPRPWTSRSNNFLLSTTPLGSPWADGSGGCWGHTPAASPESAADHRREVSEVGELVPTRSKGQESLCWGGSTRRTESAEGAAVQDYRRQLRGHIPLRPFQTQQQQKKNCSPSSSCASSRQSLFLVTMWSVRTGDECEEVETLLPWRLNSWPEALRNKKIPINTSCKTYEDTLIGNNSGNRWLRKEEKRARCGKCSGRTWVICTEFLVKSEMFWTGETLIFSRHFEKNKVVHSCSIWRTDFTQVSGLKKQPHHHQPARFYSLVWNKRYDFALKVTSVIFSTTIHCSGKMSILSMCYLTHKKPPKQPVRLKEPGSSAIHELR